MTVPEKARRAAVDEDGERIAPSAGHSRYFTNDFVDRLGGADPAPIGGTRAPARDAGEDAGSSRAARG